MSGAGDPLSNRLKDQVSVSISEALTKATSVLSNLHRVNSLLDVLNTLPVSRAGDVVRGAVELVKGMRADAATLLQTVYLTEIGLQSLEELDKGTATSHLPLQDLDKSSTADDLSYTPLATSGDDILPFMMSTPSTSADPKPDSPKKLKLGVMIASCVSCDRKFASQQQQSSTDSPTLLCRGCREDTTTDQNGSELSPRSKPRRKRKRNLSPQKCTLCDTSFLYPRCLLRHIKENHPDCDNPQQHIKAVHSTLESEVLGDTPEQAVRLLSHEDSIVDQVMDGMSSSNVTMETEEHAQSSGEIILATPTSANTSDVGGLENYDSVEKMEDGKCAVLTQDGKKIYKCLLCGKSFNRPYRIQRHLQVHNPSRHKVQCHLCDKLFTRLDTLETHIRCVHSNERPFPCTFEGCDKRFSVQSGLIHHLRSHMDGKPYKCSECDATFALMTEFKGHMSSEHADTKDLRRLECEICNKTFARLGFLQSHVEIHNGPSLYNCRFCSSGFDNDYSYKQHIKTHPKYNRVRKTHSCPVCGDSYLDSNDLMAHYQSEEHRQRVQGNTVNQDDLSLSPLQDISAETFQTVLDQAGGEETND